MKRLAGAAALSFVCLGGAQAQFGRGDGAWSTSGGDAQRSSWVRTDPKISKESMSKPGFAFLWKVKLNNEPKGLNGLTDGALLDRYIGYRGFRTLGFWGGSSDNIFAFDTDLGRVEWQKHFAGGAAAGGSADCPGGLTANVARPVTTAIPGAPGGGGGGRGGRANAAKSAAGDPEQGAPILAEMAANAARGAAANPGRGAAANPGRGGAGRGPGGPPRRMPNYIHAVSSDGMLHSLFVSNGEEPEPAVRFLPAGVNAHGLIIVNNIAYAATTQGCGNAPNGLWALDLESKEVTSWKPDAGDIAGSDGPSLGPDGTLYVATTGGDLVALEPKTLKVKDVYNGGKAGFSSTPVIFAHKTKTLLAVSAKDGTLHLLDTAAMKAAVAKTSGGSESTASNALSTWQDPSGTPWILGAMPGAVAAWKVVDQNDALSLERGWVSRDMVSPQAPMIVNGVVFAVSSGEFRGDAKLTAAQRVQRSTPAVLYALDAGSGKELWSSGKTMTSFVHSGGISGSSSQLYLGTYDGTLYAFGFPIEH